MVVVPLASGEGVPFRVFECIKMNGLPLFIAKKFYL
jgi:hypothetical protein